MRYPLYSYRLAPLIGAALLTAAPLGARAGENDSGDDWRYAATVYLWGAGIDGQTVTGSDVNVSFDTLLDNLNMAFMGAFEARNSRWSMLADVVYLNVGVNDGATVPVQLAPGLSIDAKTSVKAKGWVLDFIGGYNLWRSPEAALDLLAGARYLDLKLDFGLTLDAGPYWRQRERSASGSVWDAVIGAMGHLDLTPKVYVPYYLDVGTGQSDLTWQASTGLAYRFNWGDVSLLYRYIYWDFGSDGAIDNINFSGPLLAAKFKF
jgi:hypothetical protein